MVADALFPRHCICRAAEEVDKGDMARVCRDSHHAGEMEILGADSCHLGMLFRATIRGILCLFLHKGSLHSTRLGIWSAPLPCGVCVLLNRHGSAKQRGPWTLEYSHNVRVGHLWGGRRGRGSIFNPAMERTNCNVDFTWNIHCYLDRGHLIQKQAA